ncbi:MAG: serine/threonine-protein kinase [Acidobacteria bacterium]|nr:serine/threonine-protein kinase [Acidobacteriota bacterium]
MIGTHVGPYRVLAKLGEGGMGEVHRARDTRLDRDVAIKILPELFAADPDRLMRFEREAKTLAALNHPGIAQIYGIEEAPAAGAGRLAVRALVMELVDGEDLSQVIARGPVPLEQALPIARQIAEALEAAHDAGVVHRDLKPANIKVRPDGAVKVLDFGLAKAMDPAGAAGAGAAAHSPTFTSPAYARASAGQARTELGIILGTAAYMAPEQAKGQAVDRRADIWAFGVVLYEMLTGRPCFGGASVPELMASVMKDRPDFDALPAGIPPALTRLLARCLEKDPRRRLSAIGDARWDLEESAGPAAAAAPPPQSRVIAWVPWTLAAAASALALWALTASTPVQPAALEGHFTIELPADAALVTDDEPRPSAGPLAIAPDGRQLVYVAPSGSGTQLFVRAMADLTPRALPGTDDARLPFFSPDGQWVGFFAGGKLKKTRLSGGTPVILADAAGYGGSWGPGGEIVFSPGGTGLFVVPESGGQVRQLTKIDGAAGEDRHGWPQVLPGDGAALFGVVSWSRETSDIAFVDLTSGARRVVQQDGYFAKYVPGAEGGGGHILFVRGGVLLAAPFDPAGSGPAGTPVAVLDHVRDTQFDISASGVLAYVPGSSAAPDYSLVWTDRSGAVTPINDLPRGYEDLHLSPDGRHVVLTVEEAGADSPAHVWLADTTRRTVARLTFEGFSRDPVWAPDGRSVVFGSKRGPDTFGLYIQRLDGGAPAELLWASPIPIWPDPQSWTPDGRTVVFTTKGVETGDDIWTVSLDDRTARPWLVTAADEWAGRLSPDGRWMAYNSTVSGQTEVYVQPYPGPGARRVISQGGGYNPIWSRDGREIFYRRDDEFLVVKVDLEQGGAAGTPTVMFSGRYRLTGRDFDVSPDGTRFVLMQSEEARSTTRVRIVLDAPRLLDTRGKGTF